MAEIRKRAVECSQCIAVCSQQYLWAYLAVAWSEFPQLHALRTMTLAANDIFRIYYTDR